MNYRDLLPTGLVCCGLLISTATAQPPFPEQRPYQPLNQMTPPGTAGMWAGALGKAECHYFQPVKVVLPAGGKVTFLNPGMGHETTSDSPAQVGVLVGPVYRFRISEMPDYPGVVLYPTLELIDRLHPPAVLKQKFPVPVEFSETDIQQAINDQLVTKIVYLEQPDLAAPFPEKSTIREELIPQNKNLITEADLRGRPVMYVRLGGRIPTAQEFQLHPGLPVPPVEVIETEE